ncbi:hypothetical protein [Paenibacillus sp. Z6-24]
MAAVRLCSVPNRIRCLSVWSIIPIRPGYIVKLYYETNTPTRNNSDIPDAHIQSNIELKVEIKFPASMRTSDVMLILQSQPDARRINLD